MLAVFMMTSVGYAGDGPVAVSTSSSSSTATASVSSYSSDDGSASSILTGMAQKAFRGIVNLTTGFVEFPAQIYKGFEAGCPKAENELCSKGVGTVLGIFRGVSHSVGRTVWGAVDLASFWAASPEENPGLPLDAEYAWERGERHSLFDPSFTEGAINPVGSKLIQGLANGIFGIAELPGQTLQGIDNGDPIIGFGKGIWHWFSREAYGIAGVLSCIVPNPSDNPGASLDGEYPWSTLEDQV